MHFEILCGAKQYLYNINMNESKLTFCKSISALLHRKLSNLRIYQVNAQSVNPLNTGRFCFKATRL